MKPDVTMFSDASVFADRRKSGWGFWIKGDDRDSMSAGGPIEVFHPNSDRAELDAIANGLACADAAGYFRPSDRLIMIQSDNAGALMVLQAATQAINRPHEESAELHRRKKPLDAHQQAAADRITAIIRRHGLTVLVRHVRGHKDGGGRNWVNRHCDRLAKQGAFQPRKVA